MADGYHVSATAGSPTFLVFTSSMTLGRSAGGPLLEPFGRVRVVRFGAVATAPAGALGTTGRCPEKPYGRTQP